MSLTYHPSLVLLSLLLAIQGSYVGLRIALQVSGSRGQKRRLLLTGAACSLAVGVWSMHFVGMLAARLPVSVNYLVLPTLLSFLVCVLVVGFALEAVSLWPRAYITFVAAPIFMGSGIAAMHYIGMSALHDCAQMTLDPVFVVLSILISMAASAAALWLAFDAARRPPLLVCALLLGLAISGMHYTAMAGTALHPLIDLKTPTSPAVSMDLLAIVVTVVAFALSGVFLLTFVPEEPEKISKAEPEATPAAPTEHASRAAEHAEMDALSTAEPAVNLLVIGPTPRRLLGMAAPAGRTLPIEREGVKQSIKAENVFAVQADAHYTFVFDGQDRFFCPLAIGEVEEQLAGGGFLRVHRSHLVNLNCVKCVRRAGDNAIAELSGAPRSVPVSRAKFGELRALLQERATRPSRGRG